MIAVIDYNMGNLTSITNALEHLGANYVVSRDISVLKGSSKIILPGVGSFRKAMSNLHEFGLLELLNNKMLEEKVPFLGICLGMQLLATEGTEDASVGTPTKGLGWIPGQVTKINPKTSDLRIPHMGFNEIDILNSRQVLEGIPNNSHFYFVHSFEFVAQNKNDIIATTSYGNDIVAIVERENICGVQFHPEKSQQVGLKLLSNFLSK